MSTEFFILESRNLTIKIPHDVAQQGSTLKRYIESTSSLKFHIPENVNFTAQEVLEFYQLYNDLTNSSNIEEVLQILSLVPLLNSITVANYLGYKDLILNGKEYNLLDMLICQFVQTLILNKDRLPEGFKSRYATISQTMKDLIDIELQESRTIYLGEKEFLIEEETQTKSTIPEQDLNIAIVTDKIMTDGKPGIAGLINYPKERVATVYTDIYGPVSPDKYPIIPSKYGVDIPITYDGCSYIFTTSRNEKSYHWLNYDGDLYLNRNCNNKDEIIFTRSLLKYLDITERYQKDTVRDFYKEYSCQKCTLSKTYEEIRIIKYSKYIVSEISCTRLSEEENKLRRSDSDRYLAIVKRKNEIFNSDCYWQLIDEDDQEYYEWNIQDVLINIVDITNVTIIFKLYTSSADHYLIDDTGKYLFIYRDYIGLFEVYDILNKVRLFKKIISEYTSSHIGIHPNIYNRWVGIYHIEQSGLIYQVYDFLGNLLSEINYINEYRININIKDSNIVFMSRRKFKEYFLTPDLRLKLDDYKYGLFIRDPLTLELKERIFVTNKKLKFKDIIVSANGQNFILTAESLIQYFHIVSEDEKEEIRKILEPDNVESLK